ncbi:hypothetical protein, partial [Paenibacillus dendritiformis]|uniref:hypothetical protein n=1 Tax=Paenibacillus dendritiformis TaxID=130049 RepID=UPI001BCD64BC
EKDLCWHCAGGDSFTYAITFIPYNKNSFKWKEIIRIYRIYIYLEGGGINGKNIKNTLVQI